MWKNIKWNRVTWYSKLAAVVLFVAVFGLGFYIGQEYQDANQPWGMGQAVPHQHHSRY